jgi:hypothetical protein
MEYFCYLNNFLKKNVIQYKNCFLCMYLTVLTYNNKVFVLLFLCKKKCLVRLLIHENYGIFLAILLRNSILSSHKYVPNYVNTVYPSIYIFRLLVATLQLRRFSSLNNIIFTTNHLKRQN